MWKQSKQCWPRFREHNKRPERRKWMEREDLLEQKVFFSSSNRDFQLKWLHSWWLRMILVIGKTRESSFHNLKVRSNHPSPLSQRNHGLVHGFPDGWLQSILTTTPLFLSFMLRQHDERSLWESKRSGGREERGEPGDRRCRRRHLPHRRHPQLEANQHGCGNVFDDDIEEVIV